ncbi:MAG: metal ABC transporter permease [Gemmataceae bacterium]|nr:metal ABC transporter permease [Gemmataceae bacterium]
MTQAIVASPALQALWSIILGAIGGVACAILGCFLVLRRLSMLGDAISHGVLPGIAVAVLLTGHLSGPGIILGAMAFGVVTALMSQLLTSVARVTEDASLGVVFTSLFAVGVVMISVLLPHRDLDPGCVLFGDFTNAVLRTITWAGLEVPRAVPNLVLTLGLTVGFVVLLWKELKISTFDAGLAAALGFSVTLLHYLFVALVAACTVAAFESLGSILVLAMLVVPPATAHLLTDRLATMVAWAAALAASAAALGYLLASRWVFDCNVGGMIATVAGGQFALALAAAPRHGLLARQARNWRLALRMAREEILGSLYRAAESGQASAAVVVRSHSLPRWLVRLAHWQLRRRGAIEPRGGDQWRLTAVGRAEAEALVRAHRLWEAFLERHFDLPLDHLHAPAAALEHFIGPQLQSELAAELQTPPVDPHGRRIP